MNRESRVQTDTRKRESPGTLGSSRPLQSARVGSYSSKMGEGSKMNKSRETYENNVNESTSNLFKIMEHSELVLNEYEEQKKSKNQNTHTKQDRQIETTGTGQFDQSSENFQINDIVHPGLAFNERANTLLNEVRDTPLDNYMAVFTEFNH